MAKVLVTGGTGYIASFCIIKLIQQGHSVRATMRNISKEQKLRDSLRIGGIEAGDNLKCFVADLQNDAGWGDAIKGCDYVLHIASPTLTQIPKDDDEMVRPALEGVLRVLKFSRDLGVKRVVLTSAIGAIAYGHPKMSRPFNENDWTDVNAGIAPYQKSKTLSERAAWHFINNEGNDLELAVVNPTAVVGPVLSDDYSPSLGLIVRMLKGEMKFTPKFSTGWVDVRDVADLHIRAMTDPRANGQRFIATSGRSRSILELAEMLRRNLGERADKVPKHAAPNWLMRLIAIKNVGARFILPQLGKNFDATSVKAIKTLGWSARDLEESVTAAGETLLALKD